MNFLITGITGFAGPHLAKLLLDNNHTVFGLIRGSNGRELDLIDVLTADEISRITWLYGDLTDYCSLEKIFAEYRFDGVFHLAAQSHPPTSFKNPNLTFASNVMGSVHLLTLLEQFQPKCFFHFCSTSEVYGNACKTDGILREDMRLTPVNPYGASKAAIDLYVQERIQNKRVEGFITRAFSHTGPRRGHTFSISSDAYQIARMMLDKQERILLIGNLKTRRVVMDVRDCVRAYYLLMINHVSGVYNVCGEDVFEMQHFTDLLIEESGLKNIQQQIHDPFFRPIDIDVQIGDTSKLKSCISWDTEIPIQQTMCDLLNYWVLKLQ